MKFKQRRDKGLAEAIAKVGIEGLARGCGITRQAVSLWTRVPVMRCADIERLTGIPRERLRPDVFGAPRPRPRRRPTIEAAA